MGTDIMNDTHRNRVAGLLDPTDAAEPSSLLDAPPSAPVADEDADAAWWNELLRPDGARKPAKDDDEADEDQEDEAADDEVDEEEDEEEEEEDEEIDDEDEDD